MLFCIKWLFFIARCEACLLRDIAIVAHLIRTFGRGIRVTLVSDILQSFPMADIDFLEGHGSLVNFGFEDVLVC